MDGRYPSNRARRARHGNRDGDRDRDRDRDYHRSRSRPRNAERQPSRKTSSSARLADRDRADARQIRKTNSAPPSIWKYVMKCGDSASCIDCTPNPRHTSDLYMFTDEDEDYDYEDSYLDDNGSLIDRTRDHRSSSRSKPRSKSRSRHSDRRNDERDDRNERGSPEPDQFMAPPPRTWEQKRQHPRPHWRQRDGPLMRLYPKPASAPRAPAPPYVTFDSVSALTLSQCPSVTTETSALGMSGLYSDPLHASLKAVRRPPAIQEVKSKDRRSTGSGDKKLVKSGERKTPQPAAQPNRTSKEKSPKRGFMIRRAPKRGRTQTKSK